MAFLDDNYNGVWDEGEQPLSDVTLELTKASVEKDLGNVVTGPDGAVPL